MNVTTRQKRLLRTRADEVESLSQEDAHELLSLLFKGLDSNNGVIPELAHQFLGPILEVVEELDGEDCFGTEGWQRGIFGVD